MYSSNKTINGLEAETTIADTDELVFGDVSDTNRAKKITFDNLKNEIVGDDTAFVRKSLYDANTILQAKTNDTPVAITITEQTVVGRATGGDITALAIDSDLSSVSANDDTVPSAKATKTALDLKANDDDVVHDTGSETIAGVKTFTSDPIIPDEAYGSGWNGVLEPPTKNAVYDKIETLGSNKLDVVYTNVTSPINTTETTLYTKTIPANTLSTNNAVRLKIYFTEFDMRSSGTFIWRFKYGSTTLVTLTIGSTHISSGKGYAEFVLLGTGATNTQEGFASILVTTDGVGLATIPATYNDLGTSAEDSTGALNLVVTTQTQSTSPVSGRVTLNTAILEKIS